MPRIRLVMNCGRALIVERLTQWAGALLMLIDRFLAVASLTLGVKIIGEELSSTLVVNSVRSARCHATPLKPALRVTWLPIGQQSTRGRRCWLSWREHRGLGAAVVTRAGQLVFK